MTFTDAFKSGLDAANKNWLLVLIQMATLFILAIGFVLTIAIPLGIAVFVFGSDLLDSFKHLESIQAFTSMIVTKYLSVAIVIAVIVTFYILLSMTVFLFIYGANCGMLARSLRDGTFKFSMRDYFEEGRRLFGPLLWFTSIISVVALVEFIVLVALYYPVSLLLERANAMSRNFGNFMEILATLSGASIMFFLFMGTLCIIIYGTGVLAFEKIGVLKAVKASLAFLVKYPSAFWFYILCVVLFFAGSISVMILGLLPGSIPYLGPILAIPFQIFANAMHIYIGFIVLASSFAYYWGLTGGESN